MSRHKFASAFSQTLRRLFHGTPNRRARRAMRRVRTPSRLTLECLESRVLLSSYIVEDLGVVGPINSAPEGAAAINAKGEVVGTVNLGNGVSHAFLWDPGKPAQDLGSLAGANHSSEALAINILGEIVGSSDTSTGQADPFDLKPGGSMTDLNNALPTDAKTAGDSLLSAKGINDSGFIVGKAAFNLVDLIANSSYSFDPPSGTFNELNGSNLPNFDEITSGEATAVAGTRAVANLVYQDHGNQLSLAAVEDINTPDSEVALPMLPNMLESQVFGISASNSSGTQFAAGEEFDHSGHFHAVVWTIPTDPHAATVLDLAAISGTLKPDPANAVNAEGDAVGAAFDNSGNAVAFVSYGGGVPVSLNSLIPPDSGITLTDATGINDSGQISANGTEDGKVHAFRLTPVLTPPPEATLTSAPDINASGDTTYSFVVTYTDDNGIDASTLTNAIQVTGPNFFSQTATLKSTSGTPNQLAATYSITAPGGTWDFNDNGTYTIKLNDSVVKNISGEALPGGTLGHFVAAINVVRGSISGTVFTDANGNGKRDAGEAGLPNADVFLDLNGDGKFDGGDLITRTDNSGAYSFGGLLPAFYVIKELPAPPHAVTSPTGDLNVANVGEGQNVTGLDFGDVADPQLTAIAGQSLLNAHGKTAQFDQPATLLQITGFNFDPLDVIFFGNDQAKATLHQVSTNPDGSETLDVFVPDLATTGPLVAFSPRTNRFTTLLSNFTVDSYRNVNGYSFDNDGKTPEGATNPDFSFDELTTVFGGDQTDVTFFGFDTGIPSPIAYVELGVINHFLSPSIGLCLGFSVSSARFSLGLVPTYNIDGQSEQIEGYPTTNTDPNTTSTVWQLTNSDSLRQLIRLTQLEQTSDEVLGHYATQVAADEVHGVSNLINDVKSELAQGRPVPIGLLLPDGGHCVLAYNVEDGPGGTETLDVYDPDLPYDASKEESNTASTLVTGVEDGTAHAKSVQRSTITFDSSGHWTYDGGAVSSVASGGLGSISPIPLSLFDSHSLAASSITTFLIDFAFGSAAETQVSDSSGHTLLNADGTPNTDPNTMVPNAARFDLGDPGSTPLDLIPDTGNFMQTITGTGGGTYNAGSFGNDAMATLSGEATAKGQTDQFGLDPSSDKLTFIPGANKELNVNLMTNASDGSQRGAQLSATASSGAAQTLQFQGDHVVYHNTGGAGTFSLNLSSNASGKGQTFATGRMTLAAGDSVDVLPSNWTNIQNATAKVVVTHADGSTTTSTISNGGAGVQVNEKEGVSFTATVARFTNQTATGKSAVIDWGDGTTSSGTVAASGADVTVSGSHTYAKQGYFPILITLSDANGPIGQATGQAVVADTRFSLASTNVSAFAGVPFTGTVARLTDIPSGDVASDFDAKISWGDGTTSTGTLQSILPGQFLVVGSHTWATNGTRSVTVTVTEHGSASGQGPTINTTSSTKFSGTIAQLQLPIPGSVTANYVASIDWGDGTTSTGTLTLQADGSVVLSGSHSYATINKSFVTHFTLAGGPSVSTTSTAVVSPAVGTVTGTLFDDINGNGTMDKGEAVITDQTVFIDTNGNGKLDSGEPFAVTDTSGVYTITKVPAGNIRVSEVVPSGLRVDTPASGFYNATLNAGQTLSNLNFANTQLALISGTVFVDANGNGKHDAAEPGRANQIVYLDLNKDGVLQPNEPVGITDATGAFAFTVNQGSYVVRLEPFSDYTITTPTGGAFNVTLGAGSTNSNGLFGEKLIVTPPPPPTTSLPPSPSPTPTQTPPPALHTPPLLAFFDALLGGIEKVNGNGTETVIDSFLGIPLFVSTYNSKGDLVSVTIFGIDVTFLFGSTL
ncbi:MAG TPA: SdrD B-like domain-containing protein [Gemmataceae bacterium]|jgi:probable HAF family extracellular repeat protein